MFVRHSRLLARIAGLLAILSLGLAALQAEDRKPAHSAVKPEDRKDRGCG